MRCLMQQMQENCAGCAEILCAATSCLAGMSLTSKSGHNSKLKVKGWMQPLFAKAD